MITDTEGNAVTDPLEVTVTLAKEKTVVLDKSLVKIVGLGAEAASETVQLTLRATEDNEALLAAFLLTVDAGNPAVSLVVDLDGRTITQETEIEAEIVFSDTYRDKLYAVVTSGAYTVTVKPSNS